MNQPHDNRRRIRTGLSLLAALALGVGIITAPSAQASVAGAPRSEGKHVDSAKTESIFVNNDDVNDTDGNRLQAHGVGVQKVGDTYYMVGADMTRHDLFTAVACYSSKDLVNWKREANALEAHEGSLDGDLGPDRIIERPKLMYNEKTQKFVIWMHVEKVGYQYHRVGSAVSDTPCGPYTYLGSSEPFGADSRDIGTFIDDDGKGYLLSEDRNVGLHIFELTEDYTKVLRKTGLVAYKRYDAAQTQEMESPALVKDAGHYYLFGSRLTGWSTNDNRYTRATSLAGPWSVAEEYAPVNSKTYDTQSSFIVPIRGTKETTYVYMADRWTPGEPNSLNNSKRIWLPLHIEDGKPVLDWAEQWSLDMRTGESTILKTGSWLPPQDKFPLVNSAGICLDVPNGSTTPGTLVGTWGCNGGVNQAFKLSATPGPITVYSPELCIQPAGRNAVAGAGIEINACDDTSVQNWKLDLTAKSVIHVDSGLCLTGSAKLAECSGDASQQLTWNVVEPPALGVTATPASVKSAVDTYVNIIAQGLVPAGDVTVKLNGKVYWQGKADIRGSIYVEWNVDGYRHGTYDVVVNGADGLTTSTTVRVVKK